MYEYTTYVRRLEKLAIDILDPAQDFSTFQDEVKKVLDGEPSEKLRQTISIQSLRKSGAFFTPANLATAAVAPIKDTIDENSVVADIACGVGDLLLACTQSSKAPCNTSNLISLWNKQLVGLDVHSEFIAVAKLRLLLSAIYRSTVVDFTSLQNENLLFQNIKTQNAFDNHEIVANATHLVINPPFNLVSIPNNYKWADGKVNYAAVFLDFCVSNAKPGTQIAAILPDVLRSGSRYKKWRYRIEEQCAESNIELYGRFDKWADVHVFLLHLVVGSDSECKLSSPWVNNVNSTNRTVGDIFEVSVGSVVDYRDPHNGDLYLFAKPRELAPWETVEKIESTRKFSGRVFLPPFVAVRRTSRQEDNYRAVATIINTPEPIAVENHLVVLIPKSGAIEDCHQLLVNLKSKETNNWLNQRIQCRHLTVTALRQLPWWL